MAPPIEEDTGEKQKYSASNLAGKGNPYDALLYSSFFALLVCFVLFKVQRLFKFSVSVNTFLYGVKDVVEPLLILILAWSIGAAFEDLKVALFIVNSLKDYISPSSLPALVFVISMIVSFTTGTSWGTMTIMYHKNMFWKIKRFVRLKFLKGFLFQICPCCTNISQPVTTACYVSQLGRSQPFCN